MDENKPGRRWLSFGIRDLLWAMVVLGLAIALWLEHRDNVQLRADNQQLHHANAFTSRMVNKVMQQSAAK